ncbi:MAG: HAD family phosphatase [Ruminococcus sp.]|nr:HAD family phosphatase [Ruminococcus sp.]
MIKGIIFDLDGTLIDSMKVWFDVDRKLLRENGITTPSESVSEQVRTMSIEQSSRFFIEELGLKLTQEQIIARIEELVRIEYEQNIPLKPHVEEILGHLDEKGIPYGIATATYKSLAEAVLKRLGIFERFRFVLTDVDYPRGKRFPEIFLGAAERLGTIPEETLVIEDSLHCIETAVRAGFRTAAVYDEVSAAESDEIKRLADVYADSLADLQNILGDEFGI